MSSRLIYGFHAVTAKLRHDPESVKEIVFDPSRHDARARDLLAHAELQGIKVIGADGKRLDGMAPGARHQGVVALIEGDRKLAHLDDVLDTLEEPAFLLVLDGITDPRNLGACLRVADAEVDIQRGVCFLAKINGFGILVNGGVGSRVMIAGEEGCPAAMSAANFEDMFPA